MDVLVFVALISDLWSPFLIGAGYLPAQWRWVSLFAVAMIACISCLRVMSQRLFPWVIWPMLGLTVFGVSVAVLNNQSAAPTIWGWWLMFRYPLVGLYVYSRPVGSRMPVKWIMGVGLGVLLLEVIFQVGQYLLGGVPGDAMAGTLGANGTSTLALVLFFVLSLAYGRWISRGDLAPVLAVLSLGLVSSVLGEIKIFLFAAVAISAVAVLISAFRKRLVLRLLPVLGLLACGVVLFPIAYNAVVPGAKSVPIESYSSLNKIGQYLSSIRNVDGRYDVGRNSMLAYVWRHISLDATRTLFGDGLGAQGESRTLGTAGNALLASEYGLVVTSSLVTIVGELGLLGVWTMSLYVIWTVFALWKATGKEPDSELAAIQYGVLIFTIFWPVWLWYTTAWSAAVPALLYWTAIGYCFRSGAGRVMYGEHFARLNARNRYSILPSER